MKTNKMNKILSLLGVGAITILASCSSSLKLNKIEVMMKVDDMITISANQDLDFTWTTSNPLVATIAPSGSECTIFGNAAGSTTVTATVDSKEVECSVYVIPSDSYDATERTFDDFDYAMKNSEPTKIVTSTRYYYAEQDVTLDFNSTLIISYSGSISTAYYYSYQVLNDVTSDSDEYISTYTGVYYTKGNTVGEATEEGINWISSFEGSITLLNINLRRAYEYSISGNTIYGDVTDPKLFFASTDELNCQSLCFEAQVEQTGTSTRIKRSSISYVSALGASVTTDVRYTYNLETIDYE